MAAFETKVALELNFIKIAIVRVIIKDDEVIRKTVTLWHFR